MRNFLLSHRLSHRFNLLFLLFLVYALSASATDTVTVLPPNTSSKSEPISASSSAILPKQSLRSRFLIGGEFSAGAEIPNFLIVRQDPDGIRYPLPPRSWMLSANLGFAYYVSDSCQYQGKYSCVDVLLHGGLGYQYLDVFSVSSFQIQVGLELNLFFGTQRIVALMIQAGAGYGYFSDSLDTTLSQKFNESITFLPNGTSTSDLTHRFLVPIGIGLIFPLPKGFSLYTVFHTTPMFNLNGSGLAVYTYVPTIGLRYRF